MQLELDCSFEKHKKTVCKVHNNFEGGKDEG